MDHYRVLPTDPRYLALTDEQVEVLFFSFLSMPTEEQWKEWYRKQKAESRLDIPVEQLKEMHYSDAEIAQIRKELASRE